ncbi:MAG: hypothetical protein MUP14_05440 [Dehalococcoidia bacterium]|nr:hypothetical protein [Dehalococcoidia bacterium]
MDLEQSWQEVVGVAAATTVSVTVPQGERWRVIEAWTSQDDAALTVWWVLTRDGHALIISTPTGSALNERIFLYDVAGAKTRDSIILRFGDVLSATYNSMAVGKKATLFMLIEIRRGETA